MEDARNIFVNHPPFGIYDRFEYLLLDEVSLVVEIHSGDHYQPVTVWFQGANTVGELLRQHRDAVTREIDRSPAPASLCTYLGGRGDIVRYIGDGNKKPPTEGLRFQVDSIVEVLCGYPVDGDEREIS